MTSSSIYARFASLATSLDILVVGSHPKLFSCFGLDLKLLRLGQIIKQQASSLFLDYYKNGNFFAVVTRACLLSLKTVSLALPGDSICYLSSDCWACDAWRTCHDGFFLFFFVVVCACCCCLRAWLCGLAQHSSCEWLVCSPCRHQGFMPLSLHLGRLFLLSRLLLPWPPLLQSLCYSRQSCWRWG
jgi:hypothetical protein